MNDLKKKEVLLYISFGIVMGLLAGGLIWIITSPPRGKPISFAATSTNSPIVVFVSGAVVYPGVYEIPQGSRINDAIERAGGFLPIADVSGLNLAALVADGDQIDISVTSSLGIPDEKLIDINSATIEELDSLPGIGLTAAKNIVEFRSKNGNFQEIEEIQKVAGIGTITFEKIKNLITVNN
jgi:competence protein ComEA